MDRIFNAIQALHNLNNIKRTGPNLFAGIPYSDLESLSEHSFKVAYLCLIFGSQLDNIRLDKILSYALIHDWAECITGDVATSSLSYRSYFDVNIRDIYKVAEGKAKAKILSDLNLTNPELNEDEVQLFGFCDVLARILELIDLKQRGYKHSWIEKVYKVQMEIIKKYNFSFVSEAILGIEEIFNRGYMENDYLIKSTKEYWDK